MKHKHKKKIDKVFPIVAAIVSAILVLLLLFLIIGYYQDLAEKRALLSKMNEDEDIKLSGSLNSDGSGLSEAEKELEYKKANYNFYMKLKESIPINVLFAGNGIVEGADYSEGENSWAQLLASEIRNDYKTSLTGENFGKDNTDAVYGYHILSSHTSDSVYDVAFICYGAGENSETFEKYYDGIIRSLKNKNPKCEIYCIIEADLDGEPKNAEIIREIADFYGIVAVDVNEYFEANTIDKNDCLNGIIPNDKGHRAYYECISKMIAKNLEAGRTINENIRPYLKSSTEFDFYKYVSKDDMSDLGNGVFEFSAYGKIATVIIRPIENGGYMRIYVNGAKVLTTSCASDGSDNLFNFITFSQDLEGSNNIRIEIEAGSHASLVAVGLHGKN